MEDTSTNTNKPRTQNSAMVKLVNSLSFFILLLLQSSHHSQAYDESHIIDHLPGFDGQLPFYFETGYIGVGREEESQLFYYFVKSERNPDEDPLLLWLTGGPGCTSLDGFLFEVGPLQFEKSMCNGSLPKLIPRQNSWTKVANIIFLDLPVGSGFSYSTNPSAAKSSDTLQVSQAEEFLRKWLRKHWEFKSNPLYISGSSYSGITIPAIVQQLSMGNEKGTLPLLNLKGYTLGNPATIREFEENSRIPFARGMSLISDELYQSLEKSCGGEYYRVSVDNLECRDNLEHFHKCLSEINVHNVLERYCGSSNQMDLDATRIELVGEDKSKLSMVVDFCSWNDYHHVVCKYWANDERVRNSLHIREGTIGGWIRCNYKQFYEKNIPNSFNYHVYLSIKGYRSLIYSGDHDYIVPAIGTQAWIQALNYSIVDDWRSWHVKEQQHGGYTRTYSNGMTYATVMGGRHQAPANRPEECYTMFYKWINNKSL